MDELTTVHHALAMAATEPTQKEERAAMGTFTFRVNDDERFEADRLCKVHGTTLPEYLRQCIRLLPKDYKPQP
jgi:hypothetical protein